VKNKRLQWLLGGLVFLGAAFLFFNFRLAVSSTQAEKLVVTTDLGKDMPVSMQGNHKISMVLVGEGPMVNALQKRLFEKIAGTQIAEIEPVQKLEPMYQNPVLVVKVGKPDPIWTPFLGMSRLPIHVGYASDGDATFMEAIEKTHTSIGKKDVANLYAEYEVKDLSLGLISRRGYHQYLADYLALEVVAALKDLYNM